MYSAREALSNIVSESNFEDSEAQNRLVDFLMNEASDYQIMSLLVEEKLPKEKFNFGEEMNLHAKFARQLSESQEVLNEWIGADFVQHVKKDVGPPAPYSSAVPLMEYQIRDGNRPEVLAEQDDASILSQLKSAFAKDPEKYKELAAKYWGELSKDAKRNFQSFAQKVKASPTGQAAQQTLQTARKGLEKGAEEVGKAAQQAAASPTGQAAKQTVQTAKDYWTKKGGEAGEAAKRGVEAGKELAQKAAASPTGQAAQQTLQTARRGLEKGAEEVGRTAKRGVEAGKELVQKAADSPTGQAARQTLQTARTGIETGAKEVGRVATQAAGEVGKQAASTIGAFKTAAAQGGVMSGIKAAALTPGGLAIGGAALAALLTYAGYKTYQRFFSKAARQCRGLSGQQKTACMNKAKVAAINQQIAELQKGAAACKKSKNPTKCMAGVKKKIDKLKRKAAKVG